MYSMYNVYLKNYPKDSYVTVYNLFSKNFICVHQKVIDGEMSQSLRAKMIKYGILVEDIFDERKAVLREFSEITDSGEELAIMVLTTNKCNCRCIYCYEDGNTFESHDLDDCTYIIDFIKRRFDVYKYKKINVIYYGGEPLLNKKVIYHLSEQLQKIFGSKFVFDMVTNGFLLEEQDIIAWKKLGLRRIKVTLDGNEECHNKRRAMKNGENGYERIVNNLSKISNMIDLLINIVVDSEVYGIEDMIDTLKSNNIQAKFSISIREPDAYSPMEKSEIILKYSKLLYEKGVYQYSKIGGNHGLICAGKNKHHFVVDANNNVYYCNGNFLKIIGKCIDNLEKESYNIEKRCKECKYLPICYGDCRFNPKCQKKYFDNVIPELLKIYLHE